MGWQEAVSNAVTLGGHQKLSDARAEYEDAHRRYSQAFDDEKASRARLEQTVEILGNLTIQSFRALKVACRMARQSAPSVQPQSPLPSRLPDFQRIERLVINYSETASALGGAGAGSAALAGSWSVVSLVGAASTGTAISTLSGVAATNATLAWFGGGALAAGGAGMAGGTAVLGGIALFPVIGFMSWHSRAKAAKVAQETNRLRFQLADLQQAIEHHSTRMSAANAALDQLKGPGEALMATTKQVKHALFPVPVLSFCVRKVRAWLGRDFYREWEGAELARLNAAIGAFEEVWHLDAVASGRSA